MTKTISTFRRTEFNAKTRAWDAASQLGQLFPGFRFWAEERGEEFVVLTSLA